MNKTNFPASWSSPLATDLISCCEVKADSKKTSSLTISLSTSLFKSFESKSNSAIYIRGEKNWKKFRNLLFTKMDSFQSPTVKTTTADLPPEILCKLFKHLRLSDLLKLKSVCKFWNQLISYNVKVARLLVDADLEIAERWCHPNRPFAEPELCEPDLFVTHCKRPILSQLKCLKLDNRREYGNKLHCFPAIKLNCFRLLEQLEINYLPCEPVKLTFPNLRILSLNWRNSKIDVELDCPKLSVLQYGERDDKDLLRVKQPETIRVLQNEDTFCPMVGTKLIRFKNLEVIKYRMRGPDFLDRLTLQNLKQLKEIHYDLIDLEENSDQTIRALKEFLGHRRALGRSKLVVFFVGLQIGKDDLSDIDLGSVVRNEKNLISYEKLHMKHYDRLQEELAFVYEVDYSALISLVGVLPKDYFRRFSDLRWVKATCPVNEANFLEFIKQCYNLEHFAIHNCDLSQQFFDQLGRLCSFTNFYLSEDEERRRTETQLEFSFIGKFTRLFHMAVEKDLSLNSLRTLLTSLGKLELLMMNNELLFSFRGTHFEFWKNNRANKFCLAAKKKTLLATETPDEIIEQFENYEDLENLIREVKDDDKDEAR